ncbi:MAG: tRNA (adenine(22)-N(1))-methyltransferase TrmK [Acholeplasmatales bacterium]|nr:tRNA (adenine(22)-N(1))-methyltransferase TrmK [Acholeplasmatales bacterium]
MNRIETLASLTKGSKIICDVGCDHGYVVIEALKNYGVEKAIAADINESPLNQAKLNAKGLYDKIEFILSDGFKNINSDFDTAIIAGMGGILIKDIILSSINKLKNKKLILQANSDRPFLRKFLNENNFKIVNEIALFDQNKYYEIIVCEKGNESLDEFDIEFGPILRRNKTDIYINHYENELNNLEKIIKNISDKDKLEEKLKYYRMLIRLLCKGTVLTYNILNTKNYYRTYFLDDLPRPTILVSPGGGYHHCSPREAGNIAKYYNEFGYHVVVVNYKMTDEAYPMPATYLAYVNNLIRKDKRVSHVIGLGFSAGGHNILEMNVHSEDYNTTKCDLLMLGYPVITNDERYSHKGSFEYLLKDKINDLKLYNKMSLEKEIKPNSIPPLFLWGTFTDESVDVMNSILLLEACKKANINTEYHLFPMGGHGLGTSDRYSAEGNDGKSISYINKWLYLSNEWIKNKLN